MSIPPKMSISGFMGYLKRKRSLMIFQRYGNMKFAYRNREFWCKRYYVDTAGKNTKMIREYIKNQLKQDKESDQLSFYDTRDPIYTFKGSAAIKKLCKYCGGIHEEDYKCKKKFVKKNG